MDDDFARGLALFREIYGDATADGMAAMIEQGEAFGLEQARWTADFVFARIWAREGIERKLRSAAALGMLIAQGAVDEIRYHTRMGIKNGLTRQEIEEVLYTAIPYCGFPAVASAKRAMLAGFADLDGEASG
jgi:alkylhydroperoxidase/carboxymuconolactone decarboxylase family protein YurZ